MQTGRDSTLRMTELESVIATAELHRRAPRPPDYETETQVLASLAQAMTQSPEALLRALAAAALSACRAGSAGVSLIEEDGLASRWHAVEGALEPRLWGTMPRAFSPCGTVADRNELQLFSFPQRHFTYLEEVSPAIVEALLVPFPVEGRAAGALWVVSHDERRRFDLEDARFIGRLAKFAAACYQLRSCESVRLPPAEAAARPASAPLRILVVDDHRDTADALAWLLQRSLGHEVFVVYDGASALKAAETHAPDVILQDLSLPGMDGYEVARRFRQSPVAGDAMLVAMTGYPRPDSRRLTEDAGFDRFLVKPLGLAALQEVLVLAGRNACSAAHRRDRRFRVS
jgi:CheY-like chemotaxis protein